MPARADRAARPAGALPAVWARAAPASGAFLAPGAWPAGSGPRACAAWPQGAGQRHAGPLGRSCGPFGAPSCVPTACPPPWLRPLPVGQRPTAQGRTRSQTEGSGRGRTEPATPRLRRTLPGGYERGASGQGTSVPVGLNALHHLVRPNPPGRVSPAWAPRSSSSSATEARASAQLRRDRFMSTETGAPARIDRRATGQARAAGQRGRTRRDRRTR